MGRSLTTITVTSCLYFARACRVENDWEVKRTSRFSLPVRFSRSLSSKDDRVSSSPSSNVSLSEFWFPRAWLLMDCFPLRISSSDAAGREKGGFFYFTLKYISVTDCGLTQWSCWILTAFPVSMTRSWRWFFLNQNKKKTVKKVIFTPFNRFIKTAAVPKFETPAFFPQMLQFKLQAVNKTKAVRSDQQLLEQPHKIKSEYNLWSIFKTTFICHFYHNLACESLKHCQSNFLFFVSLPAWIQTLLFQQKKGKLLSSTVDLLSLSLSSQSICKVDQQCCSASVLRQKSKCWLVLAFSDSQSYTQASKPKTWNRDKRLT